MFDIKSLFTTVNNIFTKTNNKMYISKKTIAGFNLAVLPEKADWIFSTFDFGNNKDVHAIWELYYKEAHFKTVACDLCTIDQKNNLVVITDEQNKLVLDNNAPSSVQKKWKSSNGIDYIITGTVPKYYNNHLLYVIVDHVPTYTIFLHELYFTDLFLFLSNVNDDVVAIFNGGFGSDIYHYHVHLTNQKFVMVDVTIQNLQNVGPISSTGYILVTANTVSPINALVLYSPNINDLFQNCYKIVCEKYFIQNSPYKVSANFFVKNINNVQCYIVILLLIDNSQRTKNINGCDYTLIAPGYVLTGINCFNVTPANLTQFEGDVVVKFTSSYIPWSGAEIINILNTPINNYVLFMTGQPVSSNIFAFKIEQVYLNTAFNSIDLSTDPRAIAFLKTIDCFNNTCTPEQYGLYKYIVGKYIVSFKNKFSLGVMLGDPSLYMQRIGGTLSHLELYAKRSDQISSKYLYFKGSYLAGLLKDTFDNLLLITSPAGNPSSQMININLWLEFIFKRIGEVSAYGANTISNIRNNKNLHVDFVVKIQKTDSENLFKSFEHEFYTSLIINEFRNFIPNFVLFFGGFSCNSSNVQILCDGTGSRLSYLLLENIDKSETLMRTIKTPAIRRPTDITGVTDMIYQIMASLSFSWQLKHFTHYDLHIDNIMVYNFIGRKDFTRLSKIYDEYGYALLPDISNVVFQYYIQDEVFNVPAEFLYIIIDYGGSYVYGVDPQKQKVTLPDACADVYTFLTNLLLIILSYKPWLMINMNTKTWEDNELVTIFKKFLYSYQNAFTCPIADLLDSIKLNAVTNGDRFTNINNAFIKCIKQQHKLCSDKQRCYAHYLKNFDCNMIADDFKDSINVLRWLRDNIYSNRPPIDLNNDSTVSFKFGFVPPGDLQGIQPSKQILKYINTKRKIKSMHVAQIKQL